MPIHSNDKNVESTGLQGPRLGQVLITQAQIARRVRELADEIMKCYDCNQDCNLLIVAIMTGSMIFLADLVRALPLPMRIAVMMVSNYPGQTTEARGVRILYDIRENVAGKDVLVIDDILDTGRTMAEVVRVIRERGAKSVRVCVLLEKMLAQPKEKDFEPDFVGFQIPDKFVVGYGLDYDNLFRNYPQIAILEV